MFAEEKPALLPLPLEPFRYYQHGERVVHLDGCVEVEAAYYGLPPGWIGREVKVQWDELYVRILDPKNGQLLREHVRQKRGLVSHQKKTIPTQLRFVSLSCWGEPAEPALTSAHSATLSIASTENRACAASWASSRLAKKFGTAAVEDACAAALEMGVHEYRFVRRYLERGPQLDLAASRSAHSRTGALPRSHQPQNQGARRMNLIELNRALRQLRLGGIAAVLETRLRQAQAEAMAPIDLLSCLVSDELTRRGERLLERRTKAGRVSRPAQDPRQLRLHLQPKMNRSLVFDLATGAFIARHEDALFLRPARHRQKSSGPGHRTSRHPTGLSRALPRNPQTAR